MQDRIVFRISYLCRVECRLLGSTVDGDPVQAIPLSVFGSYSSRNCRTSPMSVQRVYRVEHSKVWIIEKCRIIQRWVSTLDFHHSTAQMQPIASVLDYAIM